MFIQLTAAHIMCVRYLDDASGGGGAAEWMFTGASSSY